MTEIILTNAQARKLLPLITAGEKAQKNGDPWSIIGQVIVPEDIMENMVLQVALIIGEDNINAMRSTLRETISRRK